MSEPKVDVLGKEEAECHHTVVSFPSESKGMDVMADPEGSRDKLVDPPPRLTIDWDEASHSYVVSDEFSSVYGTGPTSASARGDYVRSLFDYKATLEEREHQLGRGAREELVELVRRIIPRQ